MAILFNRRRPVTVRWLRWNGACKPCIRLFLLMFGDSAELTRANLLTAARAGFDLSWLAFRILTPWSWICYRYRMRRAYRIYKAAARTDHEWWIYSGPTRVAVLAAILRLPLEEGTSDV